MKWMISCKLTMFFQAGENDVTKLITYIGYPLVTVGYRIDYSVGYIMPIKMTCRPRKFRVLMHDKGPRTLPAVGLPVAFLKIDFGRNFNAQTRRKK